MILKVLTDSDIDLTDFCERIIETIKSKITAKINTQKLIIRDEYLNKENLLTFIGVKRPLTTYHIISIALNNFIIEKASTNFNIKINPNLKVFGTDNTVTSIIKLIEFGNSELPPLNLFKPVLTEIANNLSYYYELYLEGLL